MLRLLLLSALLAAAPAAASPSSAIDHRSVTFSSLVPKGARLAVLGSGFTWTEGPVWIARERSLFFSDPPANRMYRWTPGSAAPKLYLEPSGGRDATGFREAGSNGLKPAGRGLLLVADEGDRAIALLDLRSRRRRLLVQLYDGKRLNSPNDLAVGPDGAIWFTDPPYGLEGVDNSKAKEQTANRVYRLAPDGRIAAVESKLKYPNGIAFSPDGRTLYVSNSDPDEAVILAWDVAPDGQLSRRRAFADMKAAAARGLPGLPDGMTIDEHGNVWATGPGGIHILDPGGREIGLISTGAAVSNCTFGGPDGRVLYMTSAHRLLAIQTTVRGAATRLPKLR